MGLFNYVKYSAPCPKCGTILDSWQTKDGDLGMVEVPPTECTFFYTECSECKTWINAKVVPTAYSIILSTEVD